MQEAGRRGDFVWDLYWQAPAKAVVRIQEVYLRSESLLRATTERPGRVIDVHLCPKTWTGGLMSTQVKILPIDPRGGSFVTNGKR